MTFDHLTAPDSAARPRSLGKLLFGLLALTLTLALVPASAATAKSKVRFSSVSFRAAESDAGATIFVTRTGDLDRSAAVRYDTSDGTARAGRDYTKTSGTLAFPALEAGDASTSQTVDFTVPVLEDAQVEPNETVRLVLKPTRSANISGAKATLTIVDNDGAPRVSFETTAITAGEPSGSVHVSVLRAGDNGVASSVRYSAPSDSPPTGDWSFASPEQTLRFEAGETAKTFEVRLIDNARVDGSRTVRFALAAVDNATVHSPSDATLTILDDETPSLVSFEAAAASVAEDDSDGGVYLTITRAGSYTGQTVTADYATADGTATAGSDYTRSSGTVQLDGPEAGVPGSVGDESMTIFVPVSRDPVHDGDEWFDVTLSKPSPLAEIGSQSRSVVTILDTTPPPPTPGGGSPGDGTLQGGTTDGTMTDGGGSTGGGAATDGGTPDGGTAGRESSGGAVAEERLSISVSVRRGRLLKQRGTVALVTCSRSCATVAKGGLKVRGARKGFRLRSAKATLLAAQPKALKVALTAKTRRAMARAARSGTAARLVLRVSALDAAGQVVTVTRKVRVRL